MIVALAGGVGGAKLAQGLALAAPDDELAVVVNTADDFDLYGLRISPDLDTVMYTLAGLANPDTGWGVAGDTFEALEMLGRYGEETWFRLGDRDLATHITRTHLLREGQSLMEVTARFASALGVRARLLPMCDEPVATLVETPAGELGFQDYFVRRRQTDDVWSVRFMGIESARLPQVVRDVCASAEVIVFCPSNPIVSVGPILAVPGMREALAMSGAPKVAVSPIVGGRALKGPADRMLQGLGREVSPLGVARIYQGLIQGMVIDRVDADLRGRIEDLDMRTLATDTVMRSVEGRRELAAEVLTFARSLAGR
jgi:LPPG:FO 2-phospho-L-lactate transferase